jgi:hypothetical protein
MVSFFLVREVTGLRFSPARNVRTIEGDTSD